MQDLPHLYQVSAHALPGEHVAVRANDLPELTTDAPAEFGGPGDRWSPETLLAGAIADCFVLTFRAVSRASKLEWSELDCSVEATLDRPEDKVTRFTKIRVMATLKVPADVDPAKADRLLHKAEQGCLITNSLTAETALETTVEVAG
jgi:organic hydroperoxide reductase OsmC/OhrA